MTIKELRKGEYFTRKDIKEPRDNQVWVREEYDRSTRKYYAINFADCSRSILLKADTQVFTGFTF